MTSYLLQTVLANAILASLFAATIFVASLLLARPLSQRPAVLHALWIIVLLKLLMPMSLAIPVVSIRSESELSGEANDLRAFSSADQASLETSVNDSMPKFLPAAHLPDVLVASWACGALLVAGVLAAQVARFSACIRKASPAPAWMQREAVAVASRLRIDSCPRVCIVDAQLSPLLWAMGSYAVVLPKQLTLTLSQRELRSILKHELMHLRRRDHWWRWLELVAVVTYWWLPLAWWARRQLRAAEELCCDLAVLEHWPECAKEYAHTLIKSNDWLTSSLPVPQVASGFGSASLLKWRITMILNKRLRGRLSAPAKVGLLLAAVVVLPLSPLALFGDESDGNRTITIEVKKDGSIALHLGGLAAEKNDRPAVKKEESALKKGVLYLQAAPNGANSGSTGQEEAKTEGADQKEHRPLNLTVQRGIAFYPDDGEQTVEDGAQWVFEVPQTAIVFQKEGKPRVDGENVVLTHASPAATKVEGASIKTDRQSGALELYLNLNSLKAKQLEIERKKAELAVLEAELKSLEASEEKQPPVELQVK